MIENKKLDQDLIEHVNKLLEAFDHLPAEIRQKEFSVMELSKITTERILEACKLGTADELKRQCEKSLLLKEIIRNLSTFMDMAIMCGVAEKKEDNLEKTLDTDK